MLVVALINFGVKKQVQQISFKIVVGDLISFLTLGSDMKLFGYDLLGYDMILFVSFFKFQELSVMLVVALINFGVKNQVPQVSFKVVVGDLISFFTLGYEMKLFVYDLFGSDLILFGLVFKFK